jgi:hypothetical protein
LWHKNLNESVRVKRFSGGGEDSKIMDTLEPVLKGSLLPEHYACQSGMAPEQIKPKQDFTY